MPAFDTLERLLKANPPTLRPREHRTPTAVALILRETPAGLAILFIERALHEGDPWSGNIGFPGGKIESRDGSARRAVERETREEIGLDLAGNRLLGRLSDITGAHLPVLVSCFVYGLERPAVIDASGEVRSTFWVPLDHLLAPLNHRTVRVRFAGKELDTPAILIPELPDTPLWGITYRLVMQFAGILGNAPPEVLSA
jgi:8-oxo-dGTP pyrophosphatase MutT (NUDIX family)